MRAAQLTLPADAQGFVRRRCPRCSREFKTQAVDEDAAAAVAVFAVALRHDNADELSPYVPGPTCIYCGACSPATALLTPGQRRYLERVAEWLSQHVRHEHLVGILQRLDRNPNPTFIPVPPGGFPAPPAEADDLRPVVFPCCGEDAKADCAASRSLYCPRCGAAQLLRPPRWNVAATVLEA